jgi:hypothetical protein
MSPAAMFAMLFFATTVGFGIGWLRSALANKKLMDRIWGLAAGRNHDSAQLSNTHPAIRAASQPRIDQLESQMDTITNQLDRLAESQEFLSRVLTTRIDQLPDPRLQTPH